MGSCTTPTSAKDASQLPCGPRANRLHLRLGFHTHAHVARCEAQPVCSVWQCAKGQRGIRAAKVHARDWAAEGFLQCLGHTYTLKGAFLRWRGLVCTSVPTWPTRPTSGLLTAPGLALAGDGDCNWCRVITGVWTTFAR